MEVLKPTVVRRCDIYVTKFSSDPKASPPSPQKKYVVVHLILISRSHCMIKSRVITPLVPWHLIFGRNCGLFIKVAGILLTACHSCDRRSTSSLYLATYDLVSASVGKQTQLGAEKIASLALLHGLPLTSMSAPVSYPLSPWLAKPSRRKLTGQKSENPN